MSTSATLQSGEPYSLVKRPRRGDMLETGRHGRVVVLAVHHRGIDLTVKDELQREWTISRHPERGCWVRVDS